ncbi:MAG: ATP-binding protein [Christensenellales bacterium]|jgi:DNA replication protein DnaC
MNKIEKLALSKLKQNKQIFESQKLALKQKAFENEKIKALHKQKQELLIELSAQEKQSKQDLEKLNAISKELETTLANYPNGKILTQTHLCGKCEDKGFITTAPCSCLKKIMSDMLLEESGIVFDMELLNSTNFDVFENKEKMQKVYDKALKWTSVFKTSKVRNWAFLGHTGTGKTHLMLLMAKNLIDSGNFVYFTTAFNLTQEMLKQHTDFEDKNRDYLAKYLECDVLFIDDLGTEPIYKNVNENYLYLILNQRMVENKPVVFSSNLDFNQLEDLYGERIFSRLINKRISKALLFDGNDLRLQKERKI